MKHGEEPTELLLALAWSPVETLIKRGLAHVYLNPDSLEVAVVFKNATLGRNGLICANTVPTLSKTVGSDHTDDLPTVANTLPTLSETPMDENHQKLTEEQYKQKLADPNLTFDEADGLYFSLCNDPEFGMAHPLVDQVLERQGQMVRDGAA